MQVKQPSREEYHKRISSAMDYVQKNIHRRPSLEEVAASAHISAFHFHKVFKRVVGETLADYERRIRLERAASIFFYQKEVSVTEVAMLLGYSSPQNLAKCFKKHFNLTPTTIRILEDKSTFIDLLAKNSKIGNGERNNGNALEESESYASDSLQPIADNNMQDVSQQINNLNLVIADFKPRQVMYKRLIGEYGSGVQETSIALRQFVAARDIEVGDPLILVWDNPEITPADKCRTDVCMTLVEDTNDIEQYNKQEVAGGKYAYIRSVLNSPEAFGIAWQSLFSKLENSGFGVENLPCFKILHEKTSNPPQGVFDVSFCVAVKPL